MHHNYWACARAREPHLLGPCAAVTEASVPQSPASATEKPPQWEVHALQLEKTRAAVKTQHGQKQNEINEIIFKREIMHFVKVLNVLA